MGKDVIIACDFSNKSDVFNFLDSFGQVRPYVKIGMELFYSEGPQIVKDLKNRGHKIFLDLKLHDIPNTVGKAMKVLADLNVDMCNVHASGTIKMMQAAVNAIKNDSIYKPLIIAVTQLTSTSEERMKNDLLIDSSLQQTVIHYAKNAKIAGLDGVVCSPLESPYIHEQCGSNFCTVTPGIRFANDDIGDQVRITTPEKARILGSDYIVVGRSVTQANNPLQAYERCIKEFVI